MEIDRELVSKVTLIGQFVFVLYFIVFLFLDLFVATGVYEYDFLDPSLYYSATTNAVVALSLFALIFMFLRTDKLLLVMALGMAFLASPIRALFLINLGVVAGVPLNMVYDLAVIGVSVFLLYRFGRDIEHKSLGLGFVSLFYLYIFLVSAAVPARDFLVSINSFPPISFGSYLHFGFYDYLTAFYAIALGLTGLKFLAPELKDMGKKENDIKRLSELVQSKKYSEAAKLGSEILERGDVPDEVKIRALTAYALLKSGKAQEAYELIKNAEGYEGLKGDICVELGRLDEARMHYRIAVDSDPKDYVSMINLGRIYAESGKMNEAEEWWRRALSANKKDPVVWQNLTALEVVYGRHDSALEMLKEAEKYVKA